MNSQPLARDDSCIRLEVRISPVAKGGVVVAVVICGVVVVKEALDLQEIIYDYPEIPTFWQIIYQEAIRGHHLLLLEDDGVVSQHDVVLNETDKESVVESMTQHITKIASLNDLTTIHSYLSTLTKKEKLLLYHFYFQFLEDYKIQVRNSLN